MVEAAGIILGAVVLVLLAVLFILLLLAGICGLLLLLSELVQDLKDRFLF